MTKAEKKAEALAELVRSFANSRGSVSRVRTAEQCMRKFKKHYIEKLPEDPGFFGVFGNVCHSTLEYTYQWIVNEEFAGDFPRKLLLQNWNRAYEESFISEMPEATFDVYSEGRGLMVQYCDLITEVDHQNILENEGEFWFDLPGWENCQMMGYIDRIDKIDHETIRVIDYKSSFLLFSTDELANDLQASMYVHAIKLRYPWAKKVEFGFHMLRHSVIQMTERSDDKIKAALDYVVMLLRKSENGERYPASLNAYCAYCSYQHDCDVFKDAVKRGQVVTDDDASIEVIATERELQQKLFKDAQNKKYELEAKLKAHFGEHGTINAAGMSYQWTKAKKPNSTKYKRDEALEGLVQLGLGPMEKLEKRLLIIDPERLNRLVDAHLKKSDMKKANKVAFKAEVEALAECGWTTRLKASSLQEHK